MDMLVLRGGTVVDVDGRRQGDVAVTRGEIHGVGDVPGDPDQELDASGCYVAPGLVDAHVHLGMNGAPDPSNYRDERVARTAMRAVRALQDLLSAGVTATRDLGGRGGVAIAARDAVASGEIDGPLVRPAGRSIVMTGGHAHWIGREADGPAAVRRAAREELKAGADVLKCMATGGVLTEGTTIGAPELTESELEAFVEVAAAKDVPTAAHAHGTEGIKNAVRAGIDSVEHGTFMDAEAARMMADHGTYWVPTASALHGLVDGGTEAGIPEFAVRRAEQAADAFDKAFDHALAEGVPVAMGTDAGTPFNHHADVGRELTYMVEHGMTPEETLAAATVGGAELLGLPDHGRVEPGARADLVVLPEDPLVDPSAWQAPVAVVRDGRVVG
jgi:imidazolonepropionase-like amidohydrolase